MIIETAPCSISTTVNTEVNSQLETTFAYIVPIDLSSIFIGYGPLPAVVSSENQVGAWDEVGQTRTVHLSDGSQAKELLTGYEYPIYFSYTVHDFTGSLRFLAKSAHGEWWFETQPDTQKVKIKWRYEFQPKSKLSKPALWLINRFFWQGYMKQALELSKQQVEQLKDSKSSSF